MSNSYTTTDLETATETDNATTTNILNAMSVADVRRALSFIRKAWEDNSPDSKQGPFCLSNSIAHVTRTSVQSVEQFSLLFVLAHHTRRVCKP